MGDDCSLCSCQWWLVLPWKHCLGLYCIRDQAKTKVTGPDLLAGTSALVAKVPAAPYILCSDFLVSQIPQDCHHRVWSSACIGHACPPSSVHTDCKSLVMWRLQKVWCIWLCLTSMVLLQFSDSTCQACLFHAIACRSMAPIFMADFCLLLERLDRWCSQIGPPWAAVRKPYQVIHVSIPQCLLTLWCLADVSTAVAWHYQLMHMLSAWHCTPT